MSTVSFPIDLFLNLKNASRLTKQEKNKKHVIATQLNIDVPLKSPLKTVGILSCQFVNSNLTDEQ